MTCEFGEVDVLIRSKSMRVYIMLFHGFILEEVFHSLKYNQNEERKELFRGIFVSVLYVKCLKGVVEAENNNCTSSQKIVFQTTASIQSMQALVTRFTNAGWIDSAGITNSLQGKLSSNALADLVSEVKAQSGKHISVKAADYLIRCPILVVLNDISITEQRVWWIMVLSP